MLTQNEKEWLEKRKSEYFLSCLHCPGRYKQKPRSTWECMSFCWDNKVVTQCELSSQDMRYFKDAAEFEARVAVKLANPQWSPCWRGDSCLEFSGQKDERWVWNCEWCRLKYARLAVEEEMDNEFN